MTKNSKNKSASDVILNVVYLKGLLKQWSWQTTKELHLGGKEMKLFIFSVKII